MTRRSRWSQWWSWPVRLGLALVCLSAVFYGLHYLIFRDAHHIFIYLLGDVAFVFIEVLLVTVILHRLLEDQSRRTMRRKLNMVIGTFFSEVGTPLLAWFAGLDAAVPPCASGLIISARWTGRDFTRAQARVRSGGMRIEIPPASDLSGLCEALLARRPFLLNLLANANLLEHQSFTNLLWAVFHLTEELSLRPRLTDLPDADRRHLAGDIERAYRCLIGEWLAYIRHLQEEYPYLFSLAVRANPLDPQAGVVIQD